MTSQEEIRTLRYQWRAWASPAAPLLLLEGFAGQLEVTIAAALRAAREMGWTTLGDGALDVSAWLLASCDRATLAALGRALLEAARARGPCAVATPSLGVYWYDGEPLEVMSEATHPISAEATPTERRALEALGLALAGLAP